MDFNEILKQVNAVFIDILDNDSIKLTPNTTAKDIEEWDSLSHIQIIVNLEKHFKVKFTTPEIQNLKNVGEMVGAIEKKLEQK